MYILLWLVTDRNMSRTLRSPYFLKINISIKYDIEKKTKSKNNNNKLKKNNNIHVDVRFPFTQ